MHPCFEKTLCLVFLSVVMLGSAPARAEGPACLTGEKIGLECQTDTDCGQAGLCCTAGSDNDSDGVPDICDFCSGAGQYDLDEDGICDGDDNCPTVPNPRQNSTVCAYGQQEDQEKTLVSEKYVPVAVFEGSWYAMGKQAGFKFAHQIISFGQLFGWAVNLFKPGTAWSPQAYYDEIADLLPGTYKDHLDGLTDGLVEALPRLSRQEAWSVVLMLNMGTEVLNMKNMAGIPPAAMPEIIGCTGFAVTGAAGTFLCHNTDAQSIGSGSAIMYWKPDSGYQYMTMDPPGWADVGFGLNEKGIAVTTNAGNPNDNATFGLPPNIMLRRVMEEADTLESAVALFEQCVDNGTFGTGGALVHVADFNQNKIAKIQIRSRTIQVTYGQQTGDNITTYIGSANHYTSDFYTRDDYSYPSSFARYDRLMELLETAGGDFSIDRCWAVLKDTNGGAATNNTISRIAENAAQSKTVFSTIFTADGLYYSTLAPHVYFEQYRSARFAGKPQNPQLTLIDSLAALASGPFVKIQWTMAAKAPFSRFNVYRSKSRDGAYRKINLLPLWAFKGKAAKRPYGFVDLTAAGTRYYYRVEAVDGQGGSLMNGPVRMSQ